MSDFRLVKSTSTYILAISDIVSIVAVVMALPVLGDILAIIGSSLRGEVLCCSMKKPKIDKKCNSNSNSSSSSSSSSSSIQ
jgi:hypothetical protein